MDRPTDKAMLTLIPNSDRRPKGGAPNAWVDRTAYIRSLPILSCFSTDAITWPIGHETLSCLRTRNMTMLAICIYN
jgi:hypothetical protein